MRVSSRHWIALAVGALLTCVFFLTWQRAGGRPGEITAAKAESGARESLPEPLALPAEPQLREQRVTVVAPNIGVRILDGSTLLPVPGAKVLLLEASGGSLSELSDAQGFVALPRPGAYGAVVDHGGFLPCSAVFRLGAGEERRLFLQPPAALLLRFHNEANLPVPGVQVRLLPPVAPGNGSRLDLLSAIHDGESALHSYAAAMAAADKRVRGLAPGEEIDWLAALRRAGDLPYEARLRIGSMLPGLAETLGSHGLERWAASLDGVSERFAVCTSDAGGQVTWDALPPGNAYRWQLVSRHAVDLAPPSEFDSSARDGQPLVHAAGFPSTSGGIALAAEETRTLDVLVATLGSVRGRIAVEDFPPKSRVTVNLRRVARPEYAPGKRSDLRTGEGQVAADDAGHFLFEPVAAGEKMLTAYWMTERGDFALLVRHFEVGVGESLDLEDLRPLDTPPLRVHFGMTTEQGLELDPAQLVSGTAPLECTVLLSIVGQPIAPEQDFTEFFEVPLGSSLSFRGLPPGTWIIDISPSYRPNATKLPAGYRWIREEVRADIQHPHQDPLRLNLRVYELTPLTFVAHFPAGVQPEDLDGVALRRDQAEVHQIRISAQWDTPTPVRMPWSMPPGDYHFFLHSENPSEVEPDAVGVFGTQKVVLRSGGEQEVVVRLERGSTVHGRLLDRAGSPKVRPLYFRVEGLPFASARSTTHYEIGVAPDGRFAVIGMPPGATCIENFSGMRFRVPDLPGGEISLIWPE